MGWTSFLEDRIERRNSELEQSLIEIQRPDISREYFQQQIERLLLGQKQFSDELQEHLDLATDPRLDLAHEVIESKRSVADLRSENERLKQEVLELKEIVKESAAQLKGLQRDLDLEREARLAPTAVYEKYSTHRQRNLHKPKP